MHPALSTSEQPAGGRRNSTEGRQFRPIACLTDVAWFASRRGAKGPQGRSPTKPIAVDTAEDLLLLQIFGSFRTHPGLLIGLAEGSMPMPLQALETLVADFERLRPSARELGFVRPPGRGRSA